MEEQEKNVQIDNKKRTKSFVMLMIYLVFFLVLIIASRTNNNKHGDKPVNDNTAVQEKLQGTKALLKSNFNYVYTIMIDDNLYTYVGKKYEDKDMFTLNIDNTISNYYIYDEITLIKRERDYVLTDKPYYLFDYLNVNNVVDILDNSKLNNETNLYEISNSKLGKVVNSENISEELNTITIYYENNKINKIVMDVTNYALYWGKNVSKVFITLEYSDYNKIDNFNLY